MRSYLDSKSFLTAVSLFQIMMNHFREKDSSSTFTEMSNAINCSTKSPHDAVVRLLKMTEKVLILAKEEG